MAINKIRKDGIDYDIGGSGDTLPIGSVLEYDGDTVPDGYVEVEYEGEIYSTTEQVIGKWIDDKPLYRKVVVNSGPFAKGEQVFTHGIENVDKIVKVEGMARRSDGKDHPLPTTYFNLPIWNVSIFDVTNTNYSLMLGDSQYETLKITQLEIIFEYTKTTD